MGRFKQKLVFKYILSVKLSQDHDVQEDWGRRQDRSTASNLGFCLVTTWSTSHPRSHLYSDLAHIQLPEVLFNQHLPLGRFSLVLSANTCLGFNQQPASSLLTWKEFKKLTGTRWPPPSWSLTMIYRPGLQCNPVQSSSQIFDNGELSK